MIAELLEDGDLLEAEFNDIWEAAPKFPTCAERIDVDSFVQIYRDIDDLFEDQDEEEGGAVQNNTQVVHVPEDDGDGDGDADQELLEATMMFGQIANTNGLVSKQALLEWEEISKLLSDGLLGRDEFDDIWRKTPKTNDELINVEGFQSFNTALDDLFDFEENDDIAVESPLSESATTREMVDGSDLPPAVLFAALANEDYLVGMEELKRWSELQEMLEDESLLPLELESIYDNVPKAQGVDLLDEAGFVALYNEIDSLFEEVDDDEDEEKQPSAEPSLANEAKVQLLALMDQINSDGDRLPCGLESTEREEKVVMDIVNQLEQAPSNVVTQKKGNIQLTDMAGSWELLYSSSSAMKFNKGLSGLGGSVPNGKFAGLVQNLQASKYMTDVEYIERIEVNPSSASFDVIVSGDWDLSQSVSLFTGKPSTIMTVEPARVMYGPTSTRADHWKSLGPMNMLDLTYLDDDLRVMRGNTSTDTIFVFRRV
jgi:hypothetical protein